MEVVARQTGLDCDGARRIVEAAESSFASWPNERPVTLRDLVQYLVVQRWRAIEPDARGFRTQLRDIVAREIPAGLYPVQRRGVRQR